MDWKDHNHDDTIWRLWWERVNIHLYLYVEVYATTIQLQITYLG